MTMVEVNKDIFTVPPYYYLAHCISADFALGAGIAVMFNDTYNMREKLKKFYPVGKDIDTVGMALLVDNVFNLVTKERSYQKPTYETLELALRDMKNQLEKIGATYLAMPEIGYGLDRLSWNKVKTIIVDIFKETDIKILICHWN